MSQLYCSECGAKLENNAKFCGECGHAVEIELVETQSNCSHCGHLIQERELFCSECGYAIGNLGGQFNANIRKADIDSQQLNNSSHPKPKFWSSLTALLTLSLLAWYFIVEKDPNSSFRPTRSNLGTISSVQTDSLDLYPHPGIHITSLKNALDKPRTFKATEISNSKLDQLAEKLIEKGVIPYKGFDINAGMSETERFRKPVTIAMNLNELAIPVELQPHTHLAYIDKTGQLRRIHSYFENNQIKFDTYHNVHIILWIALGAVSYWGYEEGVFNEELAVYPDGFFKADYRFYLWESEKINYFIHYPKKWKSIRPDIVSNHLKKLKKVMDKHNLDGIHNREQALKAYANISKDKEYSDLMKVMRDKKWVLENYFPQKVANAVKALDLAIKYTNSRGFRSPGYSGIPVEPDIYIQEKSMGANLYGEVRNGWTTRSFMVLDGTKIPDADILSMSSSKLAAYNSLKTTTLHEYFHLVQSAYSFVEMQKQLWFAEATAVQYEAEAGKYYLNNNWATSWDYTSRTYDGFFKKMDLKSGQIQELQQHGYSISYFLEYLRDKYYGKTGNEFLPKLLNDYAGVLSGNITSLIDVTSGEESRFIDDFRIYARKIRNELVSYRASVLNDEKLVYSWRFNDSNPLSAPGMKISLKEKNPNALEDAVLVIRDSSGYSEQTEIHWSFDKRNWKILQVGIPVAIDSLKTKQNIYLQRIEAYIEAQNNPVKKASTDIYFLLKPKNAAKVTINKPYFQIEIPKSSLMKNKESEGSLGPYIQAIEIEVTTPETNKPVRLWLSDGNMTTKFETEKLLGRLTPDGRGNYNLKVSYRECAHKGQNICGAWSPNVYMSIKSDKKENQGKLTKALDVSKTVNLLWTPQWKQSWFSGDRNDRCRPYYDSPQPLMANIDAVYSLSVSISGDEIESVSEKDLSIYLNTKKNVTVSLGFDASLSKNKDILDWQNAHYDQQYAISGYEISVNGKVLKGKNATFNIPPGKSTISTSIFLKTTGISTFKAIRNAHACQPVMMEYDSGNIKEMSLGSIKIYTNGKPKTLSGGNPFGGIRNKDRD
jgi:hypothetical protein